MNRIILVTAIVTIALCSAVSDTDARVINVRKSLNLAPGDTVAADTVMHWMKVATREEDMFICDSLVIANGLDFKEQGIRKISCELRFIGVTFEGDVRVDSMFSGSYREGSTHKMTFEKDIDFRGAVFRGRVYLQGATFRRANFEGALFEKDVSFVEATFTKEAYFGSWSDTEIFLKSTFRGRITDFSGAVFEEKTSFMGAIFQTHALFMGTTFKKDAVFGGIRLLILGAWPATFESHADFSQARFEGKANFQDVTFEKWVAFAKVMFQEADFREATFQEQANFEKASFLGNTSLEGEFRSGCDLRESVSEKTVDLRNAIFADTAWVLLTNVDFDRMLVSWSQLKGRMYFARKGRFLTPYMADTKDVTNVYIALENNFRNLGQYEDEDDCYYARKRIERKHAFRDMTWHPRTWGRPLIVHPLLWFTCGYGVKPSSAVLCAGGLILLFSLIYTRRGAIELRIERGTCNGVTEDGNHCEARRVSGTEFCHHHQKQATWLRRFKNAFYFSVGTFTTVGYGDWHPSGKYRYWAMVEGLVGWLLLALFLVTLGKKWIR